ncbi:hypothetical protein I4U23_025544 [Adineta vaga]|nr:hypothetical protein I4U23_025544 [Adineta vaga]
MSFKFDQIANRYNEFILIANYQSVCLENESIRIDYNQNQFFHSCPFETKQQSTYLYRFDQLLYYLNTKHSTIHYDYCIEC